MRSNSTGDLHGCSLYISLPFLFQYLVSQIQFIAMQTTDDNFITYYPDRIYIHSPYVHGWIQYVRCDVQHNFGSCVIYRASGLGLQLPR